MGIRFCVRIMDKIVHSGGTTVQPSEDWRVVLCGMATELRTQYGTWADIELIISGTASVS